MAEPEVAKGRPAAGTPTLPAGTVTFLFTDIEGSTIRWEQHPQAMRQALARHDALLHAGISAHDGVVITERGEGDSFFALFARPSDALAAACALQRSLAAEPWPREVAPIRVRMALHSGEAGMREGADYRGAAVNRCARLRAVAHGGQVLLSGATYALVHDLLPPQISLRDLGAHRLRDLTRPEQIYQVVDPALPADFPPLVTLDQRLRYLPVQLTPLIGREREVAKVRERLLDPGARLLTLVGPGGIGKTRLALQAAAEVLEAFPDGTYFVNLAPITDPDLVLPTIAQTLEVAEASGRPLHTVLRAFLQEKRLLLVLDNCEQVLDAVPDVTALLGACAGVRVLATSRALLHVQGEQVYSVPSLALPEADALPTIDAVLQSDAARLLVTRVQAVNPDFAMMPEHAGAIAAICRRLDGLPLALELAAPQLRLLSPPTLLARLERRLEALGTGPRDLPRRQQTLRSTLAWSYDLLAPHEQIIYRRLSVFVGSCAVTSIEAVCGDTEYSSAPVLDRVMSLLDNSLLYREGPDGDERVGMLETVREDSLERLVKSGEHEDVRHRHARHFLALAEEAEPGLKGATQAMWLRRLEREHGNMRAALQWALENDERELGLRLGGALWRFWYVHGYLSEGRRWLDGFLTISAKAGNQVSAAVRAKALNGAGALAYIQDDHSAATAHYHSSLALWRSLGDSLGIAACLSNLGSVATDKGDYEQAASLHAEALSLRRDSGDAWGIAVSLNNLGEVARCQGRYGPASRLFEESLALRRNLHDTWGVAGTLINLASTVARLGDYPRSTALYEESITLKEALGDTHGLAFALSSFAMLTREAGNDGRARDLYARSLRLYQETGDLMHVAECLEGLANVALISQDATLSTMLLASASAIRRGIDAPVPLADREAVQRDLDAARASLGVAVFDELWSDGQSLRPDEAIALALGAVAHNR